MVHHLCLKVGQNSPELMLDRQNVMDGSLKLFSVERMRLLPKGLFLQLTQK